MPNDIPTDKRYYEKLVQRVRLRMMRSAAWSMNQRQAWVRFYKIYRRIQDAALDADEPNTFLSYAYGLVEHINAKVCEPILRLRPPCAPMPRRMGDGNKADNFKSVAANWYSKPNMQEAFCRSKKRMVITGTRFEIDEWQNVQRKGRMWGKIPKAVPLKDPATGKELKDPKTGKPMVTIVQVDAEVERTIPIHYGFHTRYPRTFDVYPEPDKPTMGTGDLTDCTWAVEDLGELAIDDLIREVYVDPHDGANKPVYDFGALLKDKGKRAVERYEKLMLGAEEIDDNYGPLVTPSPKWSLATDYGQIDKETQYPTETLVDRAQSEDRDKGWFVRHYQADEIITVCNGKYIVSRVRDPWHEPRIPIRSECYTTDDEFLYGRGAIEPIEDEFNDMCDVHNLSMQQAVRAINKMLAVAEGAIVDWNDFKPRAGGKIRIKPDVLPPGEAIREVATSSSIPEMLQLESNYRGLMEFTSSNLDGSPGVQGTKQGHKTKGGLELISANINTRFVVMQRQALINEARRMMSMEQFFSQFAFEKMPYRLYRDDGSTALADFNKDDIYTEGRGFDYAVEVDMNWGNTEVQRNQDLFLFDRAMNYEKLRAGIKDPEMRRANLDKLMERIFKDFGWVDTTQVFEKAGGMLTPDDELQAVMQGGAPECTGDLMRHVETHLLQLNSPNLKHAVEAGKAHPKTIERLQLMIQQAMARLKTFVANPQEALASKQRQMTGRRRG